MASSRAAVFLLGRDDVTLAAAVAAHDVGVDVAGLELRQTRRVLGHDRHFDAVDERAVLDVVVRVLLPDEARGRAVIFEDVGPVAADGAARVEAAVELTRHGAERGAGEQRYGRRVGLAQLDDDGAVVRRRQRQDGRGRCAGSVVGVARLAGVDGGELLPALDHVLGVPQAAVGGRAGVPLDALAQLERKRQVVRADLPGLRHVAFEAVVVLLRVLGHAVLDQTRVGVSGRHAERRRSRCWPASRSAGSCPRTRSSSACRRPWPGRCCRKA